MSLGFHKTISGIRPQALTARPVVVQGATLVDPATTTGVDVTATAKRVHSTPNKPSASPVHDAVHDATNDAVCTLSWHRLRRILLLFGCTILVGVCVAIPSVYLTNLQPLSTPSPPPPPTAADIFRTEFRNLSSWTGGRCTPQYNITSNKDGVRQVNNSIGTQILVKDVQNAPDCAYLCFHYKEKNNVTGVTTQCLSFSYSVNKTVHQCILSSANPTYNAPTSYTGDYDCYGSTKFALAALLSLKQTYTLNSSYSCSEGILHGHNDKNSKGNGIGIYYTWDTPYTINNAKYTASSGNQLLDLGNQPFYECSKQCTQNVQCTSFSFQHEYFAGKKLPYITGILVLQRCVLSSLPAGDINLRNNPQLNNDNILLKAEGQLPNAGCYRS